MQKRMTKIMQIYSFAFLFAFGIGLSAMINDSNINSIQLVEEANATIALTQSGCEGYKQAKQDDDHLITMCNCSTQKAIGQVDCNDDGGGSDPGEGD